MVPKVLKVKSFGLPRYVWLGLFLSMAVVVGYIRYRNSQEELEATDETNQTEPEIGVDPGLGVKGYLGADYSQYGYSDTGLRTLPAAGIVSGPPIVTEGPPPLVTEPTTIIINAPINEKGQMSMDCKDGRPSKAAPPGYHWACVAGKWVPRANKQKPSGKAKWEGPAKIPGFDRKPKNKQSNKKKRRAMSGPDMPSGGAPFRRDNHRIDRSPGNRNNVRLK